MKKIIKPDLIGNKDEINGLVWSKPPCMNECPAETNARRYIELICHGDYLGSFEEASATNPFAASCGRICTHPCEDVCRRGQVDEPIQIANLKRYSGDQLSAKERQKLFLHLKTHGSQKKKVAIIGGGPSGLACAKKLALEGIHVDVIEASENAGGMLRVAVPKYRLPKEVVDVEVAAIRELGVKIKTGIKVSGYGPSSGDARTISFEDIKKEYDAVYIAIGTGSCSNLGIPGEDLPGVVRGIDFLRQVNEGKKVALGESVIVVGGGDVAMDAARTARRLPDVKEVTVVYRRTLDEMPCSMSEYEEALEEGIKFSFLTNPKSFESEGGKLKAMVCHEMELSEPDTSGRRSPKIVQDKCFSLDATATIIAIGQNPELSFLISEGIGLQKNGKIIVDENERTNKSSVFAGGDVTAGKAILIQAVADGNRAAGNIINMLAGDSGDHLNSGTALESMESDRNSLADRNDALKVTLPLGEFQKQKLRKVERQQVVVLPTSERIHNFDEVEKGFERVIASKEAMRCMNCGAGAKVIEEKCIGCLTCVRVCPYKVPQMNGSQAEIGDNCQACGICVNECPVQAIYIPYFDNNLISEKITEALTDKSFTAGKDKIFGFSCLYGASRPGSDGDFEMPDGIRQVPVWCTGKLTTKMLLLPFEYGAQHVFVAACAPYVCSHGAGSTWAEKRVNYVKLMLENMGIDKNRLILKYIDSPAKYREFIDQLPELIKPKEEAQTK